MTYCSECHSIEQGTITIEIDGEEREVCAVCEMEEDTIVNLDEDAGRDR